MTAFLVPVFFRVLFLVCVAIDVGFSSQRDADAATDSKTALNMLGINTARVTSSPSENVTCTLADTKASHYMVQLFLKLAKPSGEVINPGAVKGNHVHGFIDNGEWMSVGNGLKSDSKLVEESVRLFLKGFSRLIFTRSLPHACVPPTVNITKSRNYLYTPLKREEKSSTLRAPMSNVMKLSCTFLPYEQACQPN